MTGQSGIISCNPGLGVESWGIVGVIQTGIRSGDGGHVGGQWGVGGRGNDRSVTVIDR